MDTHAATPWTAAHQASLSITSSQSLLKLMSIVMPSNHFIFCHPLPLLLSIFPTIRVFSNESALRIRWPKYWSFSFSISPSREYSGLISFRTDWFDLLEVQGILKSLHQHHNSKASLDISLGGFPGDSRGKESACQCRRHRFDPWVRKIPWRRKWQPTPVFLSGKSHAQRSLVG